MAVTMTPNINIHSHERPAFKKLVFGREDLDLSRSSRIVPLRADISAPDDESYRALGFRCRRSRSCDSYFRAPDSKPLIFSRPVCSSKATNEIRRPSYSGVSASKSRLSRTVIDEYQIGRPEGRESRIPLTEQKNTNTFGLCSKSPIVHSLSEKVVEDTHRSSDSPRSGQGIDGKEGRILGYRLDPQGDCTRKPKATFDEIFKTGSISEEASSETKNNRRSGEAAHKSGNPCRFDLISERKESDGTRINTLADEVSTSALQKFGEIFDGCDAKQRFESDPKKCLLDKNKGGRCGGRIPWRNESIIGGVLENLATLDFKDDEQGCIQQLRTLADLAICKRNHREDANKVIRSLLHDHGASILKSVMDGTQLFQAGASLWGSRTTDTTDKSTRSSIKEQDVIPDDIKKEIQDSPKESRHDAKVNHNVGTRKSRTPKKRTSEPPKFVEYRPPGSTTLSTAEWVKQQISKPLLPSDLDSGWLYVYWDRISFGKVKIGYTTTGVNQRLKGWASRCKQEAELQFCSDQKIPHVRRLEKTIHAVFNDSRYKVVNCRTCHRGHDEWFQLPRGLVYQTVIEHWTQWMLTDPYEEIEGLWQLKIDHADKLENMLQVRETQEVPKYGRTRMPPRRESERLKARRKVR